MARAPEAPDPRVDALHATPPAAFRAARDALAKALREEGDTGLAAEVKALKRPTAPVFAVNLLARRDPERTRAVLEAADALADVQRRALAGEGAHLASAAARLTEAVEDAVAAARREAEGAGQPLSADAVARVRSTLRALAAGPEPSRRRLAAGRVAEEVEESGLASLEAMAGAAPPLQGSGREGTPAGPSREAREAPDAREAEAHRIAEARRRAEAARAALREAEVKAERLRARAEVARRAADEAAAESAEAEREVALRRAELRAAAPDDPDDPGAQAPDLGGAPS